MVRNSFLFSFLLMHLICINSPSNALAQPMVKIGKQTWMLQNLNVKKYRNGDIIPQVQDAKAWSNLTTGAWCYYDNQTANGTIYGKFYNGYEVNDVRGLAPKGYHIPRQEEWIKLEQYLGNEDLGKS